MSDFEKQLCEYDITPFGINVGDPLTGLRGILSASPQWQDE
jgi:circadian clock protein KaiC